MNATRQPVNKQSALFLSRKRRLETINEVLEKFAVEITSLETASKVRELLYRNENGSDCEVVITVKIRGDQRMPFISPWIPCADGPAVVLEKPATETSALRHFHAITSLTTFPCTSVRRSWRPWWK